MDCPKPPISIEDRKCHICGKAGHIARKCPDKDKGGRPQAKPALMAQSGTGTAIVPYRNRTFLEVVTDEEGNQQPRRPRPKGVTFGELLVTHREASQRLRKTSKFAPLIDYDDDDEYDMLYPPLSSLHSSHHLISRYRHHRHCLLQAARHRIPWFQRRLCLSAARTP